MCKNFYCIPKWCNMHPYEHFDGVGGCWGIMYGYPVKEGEDYCKGCEFYKPVRDKEPE